MAASVDLEGAQRARALPKIISNTIFIAILYQGA